MQFSRKNNHSEYLQQVSDRETEIILDLAKDALSHRVEGDFCEFGCYRGDTSLLLEKLIEDDGQKHLWIYDSFEGLPEKSHEDNSAAGDNFRAGELFVTKKEVVERFKKAGLKIPRIRKSFFENLDDSDDSSDLPAKIAFAFLDGDLYQSIKTSLRLVTPRMAENGIIIVHDYNNPSLPGVARAVEEWLRGQQNSLKLQFEKRESLAIIKL